MGSERLRYTDERPRIGTWKESERGEMEIQRERN